jgi:glucokinase
LAQPDRESDARLLVGVDIGGTKTAVVVANASHHVLGRATAPTQSSAPESFLAGTVAAIDAALSDAHADRRAVAAIGLGVPGQVERDTGEVRLAVNLGLAQYPLAQAISAVFGVPSAVENDVRAAAIGAYDWLRRYLPITSLAYLSLGTGIAAGLILDGRLYRGPQGMAGEVGHIVVEPEGERCKCGLIGCLEAVAAGPAIVRQAAGLIGPTEGRLRAGDVFRAARDNPALQPLTRRVASYVARAIQWLVMGYDVERVVLGGGVTSAGPAFLEPLLVELAQWREQSPLAAQMLGAHKVLLAPPAFNAGAWGALMLASQVSAAKEL